MNHPLHLCSVLLLCFSIAFSWAGGALAQSQDSAVESSVWVSVAARAQTATQSTRISSAALEDLRSELVGYRSEFLEAQNVNAARIATTANQIASLGAAPTDGDSESADATAWRLSLNEQLGRLRAPVIEAEEAYLQADGLIREIDSIIRNRQTDALLEFGPTPLNPTLWSGALAGFSTGLDRIRKEIRAAWASPTGKQQFQGQLPVTLLLIIVAAVLLLRSKQWVEFIAGFVVTNTRRGKGVWRFALSLGQLLLPLAGLTALREAAFSSGLLGIGGTTLVNTLIPIGMSIFAARWLAGVLFPKPALAGAEQPRFLSHTTEERTKLRALITALGVVYAVRLFVLTLLDVSSASATVAAVWGFPFLVVAALLFFRLCQALRPGPSEDDELVHGVRLITTVSRVGMLIAVLAPVLGAIGYMSAANALLYPAIISIGLIGLLVVLQRLAGDLYSLVTGADDGQSDALIPILIGFVLTLTSLPIFALVWGVRIADLTEIWARFREGFAIGESRISPTDFLTFAVIFAVGYMITRLVQGTLKSSVLPKTRMDIGGQNAIVSGLGYVGIFLAAVIAISAAGLDLSNLAIVAGALSVGIGFGLQNIVSNFVSGIILLIERPISEGDWIEVGGQMGYVRDISVRSTRIETFDRTDVIVPNSDLVSGTVTNYTRGNLVGRVRVPVGVAYGTDTKRVETILLEIATAHPMVLTTPPARAFFISFGADSLDFEIRAILRDVNFVAAVRSDMNHEINRRFAEEGIEIPFAQRDLWLRNPEALTTPDAGGSA